MVKLDLNLKQTIGLAEIGATSKEDLKKQLEDFNKEDFINYVLNELQTQEDEEVPL